MPNYHYRNGVIHADEDIADMFARYPHKFLWFAKNGYNPHYWQTLFHANNHASENKLARFRHLVAGRRGGKTLSAAWEVVFYCLFPEVFHQDAYNDGRKAEPLHVWVVTKDYPTGLPALMAIRQVLESAGLFHGVDYKENRGNRWFEFNNGSFLQFKTADDPESLRGAGLDIMWLDEAAFIASARAWEVARPALSNKMGLVITTTTPDGKNWFYDEFWTRTFDEPNTGRVEYRSIDNPYFPSEEWKEVQRTMHPMLFKQEYLASFDSMAGKELAGDWLHYYELSAIEHLKREDGTYNMDIYIGIDPAISLADTADRFAITAIGVTKDRHQIYLIDQWAGRIPFPEQVETIYEWFQKWRPRYIAIERVAYQAALIQQTMRLPGFPPVIPYWPKGKKHERILSMAPLFRIGRILIRKDHADFINEWVDYDSQLKNPKDDCLDSFEIALRGAGVVLPGASTVVAPLLEQPPTTTDQWTSIAGKKFAALTSDQRSGFDFHLGDDW